MRPNLISALPLYWKRMRGGAGALALLWVASLAWAAQISSLPGLVRVEGDLLQYGTHLRAGTHSSVEAVLWVCGCGWNSSWGTKVALLLVRRESKLSFHRSCMSSLALRSVVSQNQVVLWMQGGPGCSGLIGLFQENGPFRIEPVGVVSCLPGGQQEH